MGDFFTTIMAPIEWLVAWIMYGSTRSPTIGMDPASGVDLGAVDRRPRRRHARGDDPAVRQADHGVAQDADDPARAAEDPEEVQGQVRPRVPPGDDPGDDGAVQEGGHQPLQLVPADPRAVTVLLRPVLGPQRPRRDRGRHQGPVGPITQPVAAQAESATIFGAAVRHLPQRRTCSTPRSSRRPHRPHVGDDVPHPAPADDEEHAGVRAGQPLRQAAEAPALRPPDRVRRLRRQLPDRCPHLLVHDEPVVDVPAVLRHPPDAGTRVGRREGVPRPLAKKGKPIPGAAAAEATAAEAAPRRRRRSGPPASGCSRPRRRSARRARPRPAKAPGKNPGAAPKPPKTSSP